MQTNVLLPLCGVSSTMNLGEARIDGVDLSLLMLATQGLTLGAQVSYMDARYTSALMVGDTTIRRRGTLGRGAWSMHFSSEYVFAVQELPLYLRADYTHSTHDTTPLDLNSPLTDPDLRRAPATSVLDLRAGVRFGGLDVSVFGNNLLDDAPLLSYGHDFPGSGFYRSTTFRPRTIGISAVFRK